VFESVLFEYRRSCWLTPDGRTVLAPLPPDTKGHFGGGLRRMIQMLYHQGQTTLPRLAALLRSIGVDISERQVKRLYLEDAQGLADEADAVWDAARRNSEWISVDDTGARHAGRMREPRRETSPACATRQSPSFASRSGFNTCPRPIATTRLGRRTRSMPFQSP